jgi:hypothetical protein
MEKQVIELKGATITLDEGYELLQANGVLTVVEKEKKLPESWEELEESWEELDEVNGYYVHPSGCEVFLAYSPNKSTFRTKEQAKASIALAQLTQLVHVWREGWEPDWSDDRADKYSVSYNGYGGLTTTGAFAIAKPISFDTEEKAQKFLETFEDLIKTAAPLLWGVNLK